MPSLFTLIERRASLAVLAMRLRNERLRTQVAPAAFKSKRNLQPRS